MPLESRDHQGYYCAKCHCNPSSTCQAISLRTTNVDFSVVLDEKSGEQGIHCLRTMDNCTKFCANPSSKCWDISQDKLKLTGGYRKSQWINKLLSYFILDKSGGPTNQITIFTFSFENYFTATTFTWIISLVSYYLHCFINFSIYVIEWSWLDTIYLLSSWRYPVKLLATSSILKQCFYVWVSVLWMHAAMWHTPANAFTVLHW